MIEYNLEREDIEHYFKLLSRSSTFSELETHRRNLYKFLFYDRMSAFREEDDERIHLYSGAEYDLAMAYQEIKEKLNQNEGLLIYKPKHRSKTNVQ
jgi:hypothetical protein